MPLVQPARVNTLPLEILSSIFVTLVDASIFARSIGDKSYGYREYPTLISSVCTHWRRVSISIPYIWSYIDLMPSNHHMRNPEYVNIWLERSQNLSLRLRLGKGGEQAEQGQGSFMMNTGESPQHIDNQLGSVLLSSARRLYSFTLKFEHLAFAAEVLLALLPKEGQHPIRELAVRQNKWMTISRARLPKIEWNRLLEPLHVLHLERMDIKVNGIPCRNLVELHLINPPSLLIAQFVYILQSNPGLQTIVLDRPVFGIDRSCAALSINLPSLRYVQLLTDQGSVTSLLKLLVPGSHGLDLHLGYVHPASLIDVTLPFFQRAHVTSLYLKAQAPLLPLLTALPHLQQLGVTPYDIDTPVFAGLDSATNLLPELRTIDLNKCQFRDYSTLHPGLYALLSLPSIRRIRHFNCIHWEVEGSQESFVQLLKGGEFAATIIQALAPFEQHSSPFR